MRENKHKRELAEKDKELAKQNNLHQQELAEKDTHYQQKIAELTARIAELESGTK